MVTCPQPTAVATRRSAAPTPLPAPGKSGASAPRTGPTPPPPPPPAPGKRGPPPPRPARPTRFIEPSCPPPKGTGHGQPLKLARFQKEFLEEALADGIDAAVLLTPRGNGKSSSGGALAGWALFDDDATRAPQVPIVATTIGQAI